MKPRVIRDMNDEINMRFLDHEYSNMAVILTVMI